jgi:3-deoxy-manno-octulosonate cytidylyltransferase (CMP-KDO synthetase)
MSFSVVIPSRYASTRLPGKPLLAINGKPMIQHVFEQASASQAREVIIATDDVRIQQACEKFSAKVIMTSSDHLSGTDRLEEVVTQLGYYLDDIVVNVQGDEPLIPPRIINQVAHNLSAEPDASVATLVEPIEDINSLMSPNVVKVVMNTKGFASYFSRAPIPWPRDHFLHGIDSTKGLPSSIQYFRHIGIYAYRVKLLKSFVKWLPAPTELAESLEQLRVLWNGHSIHVDIADEIPPAGVDTQEDLDRVRRLLSRN